MIKDRITHRMNAWITTIRSVCTGLFRHGLQFFQSFSMASASGKWWWPAAPLGNPGWSSSGTPLAINTHNDFHYFLWSKAPQLHQSTFQQSRTFLEAGAHICLLSIALHYLPLSVAAFDQKWHGNVHTALEKNKVMERQPLHCQKRESGD